MGRVKTNRIYKNKDVEANKKYIKRKNDITTYRLFILLGITIVIISLLVGAMNITFSDMKTVTTISFAGLIITGILFILSVLFLVQRVITGVDESDMTVNSKNIFAVVLFMFFSCSVIFFTNQGWIPFLIALAITITILVYIYYLYQREFFLFAFFTAGCCFLLYLAETSLLPNFYNLIFKILLIAEALFILAFSLFFIKTKGHLKLKIFNAQINAQVLDSKAKYFQFFIIAAIAAVCAVLGFVLGFLNFFYMICAILGCFVLVGIYFTVKLI